MKLILTLTAMALTAQPLAAQSHAGHHSTAQPATEQASSTENAEAAAVRAVMAQFYSAIERLDATGTEQLFAPDSAIFETGGFEGTYAQYLGHHLKPELDEFKSFKFLDRTTDVRFEGPVAIATETYKFRIETKDGRVGELQGVATSVLKKVGGQWQIIVSHNSSRKPKGS